jgi:hypothetical protein
VPEVSKLNRVLGERRQTGTADALDEIRQQTARTVLSASAMEAERAAAPLSLLDVTKALLEEQRRDGFWIRVSVVLSGLAVGVSLIAPLLY